MRVFLRGDVVQPGLCCSPREPVEWWKQCANVGLRDGCVPTIGQSVVQITGLEPAVWFKVLVVDTVCIDFINKAIQWTTCSHRNCTQRIMGERGYQRCKHTHECLLNEDFFLPDVDLQRGLDLAKRILVRQDDEDDVDLLHLLHVYILPIIRLHSEDKEHVTQALTNQKEVLGELDAKIDKMSCQRIQIKENMRRWREDICLDLQSEKAIVSCNTAFLKILCEHLNEDIRNSYVELDSFQKKVEEAKLKVKRKEGKHYLSQLNKARIERDTIAERISKSLYVVEEVGFMLRLSRTPDEQKLSDMHQAYIKIQDDWKEHTQELRELQRKKVCAMSVREALVNTEKELTEGSQTTGIEITSDGMKRPTDVLGEASLPAGWETLQSQVAKSLEFNPSIQEIHKEFSYWVQHFCDKELADQHSHSSWREKLPACTVQCTQVEESGNVTCLKISPDINRVRQSIKTKMPGTHYQGLTRELQNEIVIHFREVVDELVKDHAVPSTCFSRLWTCYERCFFSSKSRDILRLYERAYAENTKKLEKVLPTVTIRDLRLDDEWILNILGLYAPDFPSLTSEDVRDHAEEVGQMAEELDNEFQKETGDMTKDKVGEEDRETRERLESGISIQGVDKVVRRLKMSDQRDDQQRQSHRFTKIIDLMWVTSPPPSVPEGGASLSERASTWSGLNRAERRSREKTHSDDRLSTSVPNVNSGPVFSRNSSPAIDIPNTNTNARTLAIPVNSSVSDSGVCLNITKESDVLSPSQISSDPSDPLCKRCQDNPNAKVFLERFQTAYNCFRVVLQDTVPMSKLQWLYRCLQEVNTTAEKQSQIIFCGKCRMLSGDDLLTALILFLLHGDVKEVAKGYYHLMLLQDYLPDFLDKGHFGFSVSQFLFAYTYILSYADRELSTDL
ncbi:uncharacterized protein LOC110991052 [Acanthaster planci]|uniref:Uncharacterized protein LOC110991052 n=1 Tax=Acanthaster planci TaxID=133434 RepID=A0A8B8A4L2_ACAPL|nr:uncharacterized protein LOC110991052 [Acanthaster planci]